MSMQRRDGPLGNEPGHLRSLRVSDGDPDDPRSRDAQRLGEGPVLAAGRRLDLQLVALEDLVVDRRDHGHGLTGDVWPYHAANLQRPARHGDRIAVDKESVAEIEPDRRARRRGGACPRRCGPRQRDHRAQNGCK